ncbi:heme-degrading domain-containing protein [Streptacidiphilus sp. ASG 303]|uniref:heme-degrading domain-containing protein n=1 Tax=Streptomycetaceae TaxID=2062 RepID=UPI001E440ADD|nr:heme-degrading domain-containing protein [Streptacidiphilus sp. ASG 303]MCD0485848.1 heme-degrading domain-containing protein [Streptacidiphilus sp. ASG 303]
MNPTDLAELIQLVEAEEKRLVLPRLDNDDAWRLGTTLTDLARARGAAVTVDVRRNGQQLFHCALPGTSADNDAWILRKSRVVDRFGHASWLVGLRFLAKGSTFEEKSRLDPDLYAAHGGAFPLTVSGVGVVGTVAVSGLPQAEDHRLVVAGLERHLAGA